MKNRCSWVDTNNSLYIKYHDEEWGIPSYDDRHLFELLSLEGSQAGLSWITILKKRDGYKKAFDNFDIKKIIQYDDIKVEELLCNDNIIKNKLKIKSIINNAHVFISIQKEFGSFSKYIWRFTNNKQIISKKSSFKMLPTSSELSREICKDLKKRGMKFIGPIIIYSYLQAIGIIDDHEISCFRKQALL